MNRLQVLIQILVIMLDLMCSHTNLKIKVTILLASHNMAEVERLCDSVIMMKKGKIIDQGTSKEIINRHGRTNLEETFLKIVRSKDEVA